jgi:hypothetical protein
MPMPGSSRTSAKQLSKNKPSVDTEADAARARIIRRKSLQKQRAAQKRR